MAIASDLPPGRVEELKHAYIHELPMREEDLQVLKRNPVVWRDLNDARADRRAKANITPISAGRTDQQIASEYADRMLKLLNQVTEVLNEARREHGMTISFGYTPPNQFGIQTLASLEISKKLC